MAVNNVSVVMAHGGWADGSSWARVITGLAAQGMKASAAPLPLSSLADDVAALNRSIARTPGPVVLAAHAYAGAVIGLVRPERVKALVNVTAFAPDEGEKLTDLFFRAEPHPQAPKLAPDGAYLLWLPDEAFPNAFAQNASAEELAVLAAVQRPLSFSCMTVPAGPPLWKKVPTWYLVAEHDHMIVPATQRFMADRMKATIKSHAVDHTPIVTAPGPSSTSSVTQSNRSAESEASCQRLQVIGFHGARDERSSHQPNPKAEEGLMASIRYRTAEIDGFKVFYREAGNTAAPKLLLLHGFPTAGHMFRDLIPLLADRFHMAAPDLPGFGQSDMPPQDKFRYTFENLARVIERFTEVIGFDRFAVYLFDYGAPTGFRLAIRHPERITAIISQNGNAYEEGLSDGWTPIRAYWEDPSPANRKALRAFLTPETTHWQYTHGVPDPTAVSPDGQNLDNYYLARPGADEIQLDLFGDYKSNVALYPTFQEYFRTHQPPFLAVWGKNDPFFLPPGAESFKRDMPRAVVRFLDTGHFAVETHAREIAESIRDFLR